MTPDQINKVQERETLEQIVDLIQKIGGDDSYVGMAMKGVYQVAISNIENDFGDSLVDQVKAANARAEKHSKESKKYKTEAFQARKEVNTYMLLHDEPKEAVVAPQKELSIVRKEGMALCETCRGAGSRVESLEGMGRFYKQEIIELKAKLYDLMTKGE